MKKKAKVTQVIDKRPIGITIIAGGKAQPGFYMNYEVTTYIDDGETVRTIVKLERGKQIRAYYGFQDLNGTKEEKKEASKSLRFDLENHIHACHVMMQPLRKACLALDNVKEEL